MAMEITWPPHIFSLVPWALGAYVAGSIPFGSLLTHRVAGLDISKRGSGNIGASNVGRTLGLGWGLLTLLLDTLKGVLPVAAVTRFLPGDPGEIPLCVSTVGLCAILGHQFSVFRRFRGGKGVATSLGVYLVISPGVALLCVGVFSLAFVRTSIVSVSSLLGALCLPAGLYLSGRPGPEVLVASLVAATIILRHWKNVARLLRGSEPLYRVKGRQERRSRSLSNSSSE